MRTSLPSLMEKPPKSERKGPRAIPTVSAVLENGALIEMVHWPNEARTAFVVWEKGAWRLSERVELGPRRLAVPYSPHNNILRKEVVLLPSEPEEYGSEAELLAEIQAFVHRYVDVSPLYETIAAYYVLLSWIYDGFNELPYLRLRGDPGSGKTRFLLTVGSLCYKPIFASGASTVSPLFRILDAFRGTLIIDEADFRLSDERAEIIKILNNGNAKGFPVLRSEASSTGEFNPRAYAVFGPKLVATRRAFEDRALESRCLTEEMGQGKLRDDIAINLPASHKEEALHLRNKLLLFRFRNLGRRRPSEELVDRTIEPRLNQIFVPLLSIVDDPTAQAELKELARQYHGEMVTERGMDLEAQILEVIRDLLTSDSAEPFSVKDIAAWMADRHGSEYQRPITPKWIGSVVRTRLHLKTRKSNGVFVIPREEMPKLTELYEKYGVTRETAEGEREAAA
ncbi:MAG: hypothetical protein ACRD1X_08970 [Vicinamibacteria bacterium]